MRQAHRAVRRQIDFRLLRSAVAKVHETNQKLNVPTHHSWYPLGTAGPTAPMFSPPIKQTVLPFEDNPSVELLRNTGCAKPLAARSHVGNRACQWPNRRRLQRPHPDSAVSEVHAGQVTRPEPHFGSPGLSFVFPTVYAKSRLLGRLDCWAQAF